MGFNRIISRRLLILSSMILMLTLASHLSSHYFINYPMKLYWPDAFNSSDWILLLMILGVIVLVSWLMSHLSIRNFNPVNKFLLVFSIICSLLLCFINFCSLNIFFKTKRELAAATETYIRQAKEDIKNDSIVFRFAGGLSIAGNLDGKIDSIRHRYGVHYQNTGCTIDAIEMEGDEKYRETVKPYLEKRNGKGWEERMKREVGKLKN